MRTTAFVFSDPIRLAHNSFRAESPFEVVDSDDAKSKDAFHFISYVPKGDKVFELDGLKQVTSRASSFLGLRGICIELLQIVHVLLLIHAHRRLCSDGWGSTC